MQRIAPIVIAVALVAGCTSGNPHGPVITTPAPADVSTSPSAADANPPAVSGTALLDRLPISVGHDEAIPATHGTDDLALPGFSLKDGSYTIYAVCTGGGKIKLERREEPALEPWSCDGVPTRLRVRSDLPKHVMKIDVTGSATWAIRIVHGLAEESALPPSTITA